MDSCFTQFMIVMGAFWALVQPMFEPDTVDYTLVHRTLVSSMPSDPYPVESHCL